MTGFAVYRNAGGIVKKTFAAAQVPDITKEAPIRAVDENDSPLGVGDVYVVLGIHRRATRQPEPATWSTDDSKRPLALDIQYMYGGHCGIADDEALPGVGGYVTWGAQDVFPSVNQPYESIASLRQGGVSFDHIHRMPGCLEVLDLPFVGTKLYQRRNLCGRGSRHAPRRSAQQAVQFRQRSKLAVCGVRADVFKLALASQIHYGEGSHRYLRRTEMRRRGNATRKWGGHLGALAQPGTHHQH